jgi:hypothetical protein
VPTRNAAPLATLDTHALRQVRQNLLEELGVAALRGCDKRQINRIARVLRLVNDRLAHESDNPAPSIARRQMLWAERDVSNMKRRRDARAA